MVCIESVKIERGETIENKEKVFDRFAFFEWKRKTYNMHKCFLCILYVLKCRLRIYLELAFVQL